MSKKIKRKYKEKYYKYDDKELLRAANLFVNNKSTLREVSSIVGISRSALSENFKERLKFLDYDLYIKVRQQIDINNKEKASRGGQATKMIKLLKKI